MIFSRKINFIKIFLFLQVYTFYLFSQETYKDNSQTNLKKENYYVNPKSYGTTRNLFPPSYAKNLSDTDYSSLKQLDWIETGVDYRTRYEYRENDYRRKDENNWSLDVLVVKPLERIVSELDKPVRNQIFGGIIGHIRQWSKIITLEPFYLGLKQSKLEQVKWNPNKLIFEQNNRVGREIHALGLRAYNVYKSGFDYDTSVIFQFGVNDISKQQRHEAFTFDLGYTFQTHLNPRLGFFFRYASGDRDPKDNVNQRFEKLYGFARPWSSNDYIQMENIQTPKLVLELEPIKKLKVDTAVVWFYLAKS